MTEAYPLQWPQLRSRTPAAKRKDGRFNRKERQYGDGGSWLSTKDITITDALRRLQSELDRIGARMPVISSNLELRLDGLPRSGRRIPDDPGIAVYFQLSGKPHCLPCDTYTRAAANIAAVAAHIEATRAIERHGVASVSEMFTGFQTLPPPSAERPWRQVFGLHREPRVTLEQVEQRYRDLAKERHPDLNGGSHAMMAELNAARDAAKKELNTD